MEPRVPYALPSTFAVLGGNLLYDEAKELWREGRRRTRRNLWEYLLPRTKSKEPRRMVDRSLGRLRAVRRARTKRRLNSRVRSYKRRRTAYRYKRTMRGRARRAMGTNGPAFRSRQRYSRYRAELGERIGYMPSRKTNFTASISTHTDKRLHTVRLVRVPWSDTDDVMNVRTGRLVDVVGVKFRAWISLKDNLVESSVIWQNPIHMRWAIINPRENTGADIDITAGTNFFQSDDPGTDDANNFPTTGNAFKYMNRKINSRRYGVLQEGSFLISNDPAADNTRVAPRSKKFISFYIPIKRQMKWAGTSGSSDYPNANLHFVYWFVSMGDKDTAQKFAADAPCDFTYEHITYFKNPEVLT